MTASTVIVLRSVPLPAFGMVGGHIFIEHGVYPDGGLKHADLIAAHDSLHRALTPADQFMPHVHPEMAPTPTHAPVDIESCDWCEEPIGKGEPVWYHLDGLAHAWHPGERPC